MTHSFVLVTGGNGFVGSQIVYQLLEKGYKVRAPVRTGKLGLMKSAFSSAVDLGQLDLLEFEDLLKADFVPWLKGINAVIHVASPLPGRGISKSDIYDGAMEGSVGILKASIEAGIKKFVYTSSLAAMINLDFAAIFSDQIIDANTWGSIKYEELEFEGDKHNDQIIYAASKQLSEKKVWEIADQHPDVDVFTVIPPAIYGPYPPNFPIPSHIGTPRHVYELLTGGSEGPRTYPDWVSAHYVDVRDVAKAHILALEAPPLAEKIHKRLLVSAGMFHWKDATLLLREKRPELIDRLPTYEVIEKGKLMAFAPMDNSLTERAIGLKLEDYIKWEQVVLDTIDMLVQYEKDNAAMS